MFIFNSRAHTLTVVLKPSKKIVVGTEVVREPGMKAEFQNGIFTTEDENVAAALRATIKRTGEREIVEITSEDLRQFSGRHAAKNIRQATSAAESSKALNTSRITLQADEQEQAAQCPICDQKYKSQRDLNRHLISHRPGVQLSETPAVVPGPSISERPAAVVPAEPELEPEA